MSPEIEVILEDSRWRGHFDPEQLVTRVLNQAIFHSNLDFSNKLYASILFCSDARIQELNLRWMNKDAPTNVLSFPASLDAPFPGGLYLGDIAIAYETVVSESQLESKPLEDHAAHMLLHGLLHLLGFDHEDEEQAALMENLESEILVAMGISDPWADYRETGSSNE
jgi:probable rRNA maturation factor